MNLSKSERLYYDDCYLARFEARIAAIDPASGGRVIYLDRTAFYPASGGQAFDTGTLAGVVVEQVTEEEESGLIAHHLAAALPAGAAVGELVTGAIDWPRRWDHMQQHTGQHLLSAVLAEEFGLQTVSVHLSAGDGGSDSVSTVDVESLNGSAMQDVEGLLARVEQRVNERVVENRVVRIGYEDAAAAEGLRKVSGRQGLLRIVSIEDLDRSACGGTHVRRTGEIGAILLRGTEKVRNSLRVQFVCGERAVRRARRDYQLLTGAARVFSSTIEELPPLVAAQAERLKEAEKARRKLGGELAALRGRELWQAAAPGADGVRRHVNRGAATLDDELRAEAQNFTGQGKAIYVALVDGTPAAVLLAASSDSGCHAGNTLKPLLQAQGGRGGGNAGMAQGSVPEAAGLGAIAEALGV